VAAPIPPTLTAPALLLAAALLSLVYSAAAPRPAPPKLAFQQRTAMSEHARSMLDECRRHAYLVHDVRWAAACSQQGADEEADCMLPDAEAGRLNAALDRAESLCFADAGGGR